MMQAEALRFISEFRFYFTSHLGQLATRIIFLGGLLWVVFSSGEKSLATLIAVLFWQYATLPLSRMTVDLWEDSYTGAFEQTYIHVTSYAWLLTVRSFWHFVYQTALGIVLFFLFGLAFGFPWQTLKAFPWADVLILLILTLVGFWGIGLGVAGLLMIYRRGIDLADLAEYILLFLAGVVIPLEKLPSFLQAVAPFLPLTLAVSLLRSLQEGGVLLGDPRMMWLVLQSLLFAVGGLVVFHWAESKARKGRGFFQG